MVTLVLLPGLDGTGLLFGPLVAALPGWLRPDVVAYPPDRPLDYDALVELVQPRLPTGGRFVLLGESFGGPLAVRLAATRPAGLVGVVLCATFVTSPRPMLGPALRWVARPSLFRLYPAYQRARGWVGRRRPATGTWAAAAEASGTVHPAVLAARVRMTLAVDCRAAIAAVDVPILYLRGTHDWVVPAGNARRLCRVRSGVSVVDVLTSHQVLQRCPAESAAAIAAFAGPLAGVR